LSIFYIQKSFTQVIVVLSGSKYLLVVCVEDNNENSELYIFDPLVKITVRVGNVFKAKITNLKVSDSYNIVIIINNNIYINILRKRKLIRKQ